MTYLEDLKSHFVLLPKAPDVPNTIEVVEYVFHGNILSTSKEGDEPAKNNI